MLSQLVDDAKKRKIVKFILDKNPEGRYHNEICDYVGGSKTRCMKDWSKWNYVG